MYEYHKNIHDTFVKLLNGNIVKLHNLQDISKNI